MLKNKRVTFLLPSAGGGGGARAVMEFASGLMNLGIATRIFYRYTKPRFRSRVYYRIFNKKEVNWVKAFQGAVKSYKNDIDPGMFADHDVVVSMCSQTTIDAFKLPEYVLKVFHCHGLEYENWGSFVRAINLPLPKIAISSHVKKIVEQYAPDNSIPVVPNGIHHHEYYRDKNIIKNGIGGSVRNSYSKDPEGTKRIFRELKVQLPEVPLYSFGMGRKPSVYNILHYTDNPSVVKGNEIYNKCKVWFLMSVSEGFGLPVLEAMACGCPVVSTKCGGPQDIIVDGKNGFNVDVGHYGAVISRIKEILTDQELFDALSINAIATAKKYTWEKSSLLLRDELVTLCERFRKY